MSWVTAGGHLYGATVGERLAHYSRPGENGCQEWTGYKDDHGYGRITVDARMVSAHRLSFTLFYGTIPDGLTVDHTCFNRACIQPFHLRLLTADENRRNTRRNTLSVLADACAKGHEWTDENTRIQVRDGRARRSCRTCIRNAERLRRAKRRAAA